MSKPASSIVDKGLITLLCASILCACGGQDNTSSGNSATDAPSAKATTTKPTSANSATTSESPNNVNTASGSTTVSPNGTPSVTVSTPSTKITPIAGAVTEIAVENTATTTQANVPLSFGQVFIKGDVQPTDALVGKLADGTTIPLQMDVKATHIDGSVRHAVISAVLPTLAGSAIETIGLVKSGRSTTPAATSPITLLGEGFNSSVSVTINGQVYTASVGPLLKQGAYKTWLSGPIANEWLVTVPFVMTAQNTQTVHPLLSARFAVRSYAGAKNARVDVTVENTWAYAPSPQNLTYNVAVNVGSNVVYSQSALTHYSHARWRKTFWWQQTPQINIRENTAYLIASQALPNYDQSLTITDAELNAFATSWTGSKTQPMGAGVAMPEMPTTGGRPDIGLMPGWAVSYLLTMDKRAAQVTMGTADLAGSWSTHYRDQNTDRPVSLGTYPYMTILGEPADTYNPFTKLREAFPTCSNCATPNKADSAHAPAMNYLPYILTGDYYQLEELQFWAIWDDFESNPGYRGAGLGLVHQRNVRDQAWSLRNIADAAYITPDQDSLKAEFQTLVANNVNWYNTNYTNNPNVNQLGINVEEAIEYNNNIGIAPWMNDFFTSVIGHLNDQDVPNSGPLLLFNTKYPVSRMVTPGYCWIFAGIYSMNVTSTAGGALYTNLAQTYLPSLESNYTTPGLAATLASESCNSTAMASSLQLSAGEMTGYAYGPEGYPSNLQPALAYSVDAGANSAANAWKIFMARSVKPDYSSEPQFDIIPR